MPDSKKKKEYAEKAAKRSRKARDRIEKSGDRVAIDSDQSFPASDPPSWTPTHPGSPRPPERASKQGAARRNPPPKAR
jgi:hypothetical protein